jgi:hypothetical protein
MSIGKDTVNEEDFDRVKLKLEMDGIEVDLIGEDVEKDLNSRAWEFQNNRAGKEEAAFKREGAM